MQISGNKGSTWSAAETTQLMLTPPEVFFCGLVVEQSNPTNTTETNNFVVDYTCSLMVHRAEK